MKYSFFVLMSIILFIVACDKSTNNPQQPTTLQDNIVGFWNVPLNLLTSDVLPPESSTIPWIIDSGYAIWSYSFSPNGDSYFRKSMQFRFGVKDSLEFIGTIPTQFYFIDNFQCGTNTITINLHNQSGDRLPFSLTKNLALERNALTIDSIKLAGVWKSDSVKIYDSLNILKAAQIDTSARYEFLYNGICNSNSMLTAFMTDTTFVLMEPDSLYFIVNDNKPFRAHYQIVNNHLYIKYHFYSSFYEYIFSRYVD
jgi:hypothetical protein